MILTEKCDFWSIFEQIMIIIMIMIMIMIMIVFQKSFNTQFSTGQLIFSLANLVKNFQFTADYLL